MDEESLDYFDEDEEVPVSKKKHAPMITLMSRELLAFNVSHENYCVPMGECKCVSGKFGRARRSRQTGIRGIAILEKSFHPSITFPAFVRMRVPEALKEDPEIKKAISEKRLRVVR